ncbi:MAG: hypothetical protein M1448_01100 [Candidatus Marsarchaeota archaeon]|jgi:Carbonic anhydrase|nr:hypothetical protein [Candidatus Marsarchaeota archaeon]
MDTYSEIIEGNRRFRRTNSEFRALANGQHPKHVVIACSDSRVEPEATMNSKFGDLFVIRVAGEVIGTSSMASVEFAVKELGVMSVIVICHTKCGAVTAAQRLLNKTYKGDLDRRSALYRDISRIAATISKDPRNMDDLTHAIIDNACAQVSVLKNSPIIKKAEKRGLKIRVAVYDVEIGSLRFLHRTPSTNRAKSLHPIVDRVPSWVSNIFTALALK